VTLEAVCRKTTGQADNSSRGKSSVAAPPAKASSPRRAVVRDRRLPSAPLAHPAGRAPQALRWRRVSYEHLWIVTRDHVIRRWTVIPTGARHANSYCITDTSNPEERREASPGDDEPRSLARADQPASAQEMALLEERRSLKEARAQRQARAQLPKQKPVRLVKRPSLPEGPRRPRPRRSQRKRKRQGQ
jgi:hypothetical protein